MSGVWWGKDHKRLVTNLATLLFLFHRTMVTVHSTLSRKESSVANKKRVYKCDVANCDQFFKRKRSLTEHTYRHAGVRAFKCSKCTRAFVTPMDLMCHETAVHTEGRRLFCQECPTVVFDTKTQRRNHMKVVHGPCFKCPECNRVLPNVQALHHHYNSTHTSPRPYKCVGCHEGFFTETRYNVHVKMCPRLPRPYICRVPKCGLAFATREELDDHQRVIF